MAAFFLRIGSLNLSHKVEEPQVLETETAKFFEEILGEGARGKKAYSDPQAPIFAFGLFFFKLNLL